MSRERLYEAVPEFLCHALGPVLRRSGAGDRAFLDRMGQTHGEAMLSRSEGHWQRLVRMLGLVGYEAVLDLGCGSGAWLPSLASLNRNVVAVDVDEHAVETARNRASGARNVAIRQMTAELLAFSEGSFDAVACLTVLPYLDQGAAISEVSRVLRKGGRFVVGTVGFGYYAKHVAEGIRHDDPRAVRYGLDPIVVGAARAIAGDRMAHGVDQILGP